MGQLPSKYNFGTIRPGRYRRFDISTAASIRQAAYDYVQRHGGLLQVRSVITRTGREVRVYRVR